MVELGIGTLNLVDLREIIFILLVELFYFLSEIGFQLRLRCLLVFLSLDYLLPQFVLDLLVALNLLRGILDLYFFGVDLLRLLRDCLIKICNRFLIGCLQLRDLIFVLVLHFCRLCIQLRTLLLGALQFARGGLDHLLLPLDVLRRLLQLEFELFAEHLSLLVIVFQGGEPLLNIFFFFQCVFNLIQRFR